MTSRLAALFILLVSAAAAPAQWGPSYHSSTLEEGVQRGAADLVRSQGMANMMNSAAAINWEQARKANLDNQMKATQTYFDMRRYNTEARRAASSPPLSNEQYVRLAREQAPDSLTSTQLDPLTGMIGWPAPLRSPGYEPFRSRIERLFQDRASGYVAFSDIQQALQDFQDALRRDISRMPANDFVAARRFLDSLAWTARGVQG